MNVQPAFYDFTLEPADNERLANLCGQFDEHLRQVEGRLGVEVTSRGNRFRVIGASQPVQAAGHVLKSLYSETAKVHLTPARVHLALQQVGADAGSEADEVANDTTSIQTRRGLIGGRGLNQQRYLQNILNYDINFGIGPAGTGKTYLAVACAVHALEQESVARVVLTRPAVEAGERLGFLPGDLAQWPSWWSAT